MDTLERPISIISVLFALSIAFWGGNMVRYLQEQVPRLQAYEITDKVLENLKEEKDELFDDIYLSALEGVKNKFYTSRAEFIEAIREAVKSADEGSLDKLKKTHKKLDNKVATAARAWMRPTTKVRATDIDAVLSILIILGGLAFLIDIACVMWWYARYIYVIHPTPTLPTHFLDFGVCATFNLAANAWTDLPVFLLATLGGAGLLLWRFRILYSSHEASGTDKFILSSAASWMRNAAVLSLLGLGALAWLVLSLGLEPEIYILFSHPLLLLTLSGIGIWLTIKFTTRIRASADMHRNRHRHFEPMELHWPRPLLDDPNSRRRITQGARKGLDEFRGLFSSTGVQHDRLISRVHAEADLRVQSYILAVPSWTAAEKKDSGATLGKQTGVEGTAGQGDVEDAEVHRKAFIVGLSHWLDDLLDGREELAVWGKVTSWVGSGGSFGLDENRDMFEKLYRDIVISRTDPKFYVNLMNKIDSSVRLPDNLRYLYFGLNRVAVGAALFSRRVEYGERMKLLESHSGMLARLAVRYSDGVEREWLKEVNDLLVRIQGREDRLGHNLLGLTTKTAQEMGMASESQEVKFGLSLLYSILYAPMLYFHDIEEEVKEGEMAALETFNVNYEDIIPWVEEITRLIDEYGTADKRFTSRRLQVKMTFRCFETHLPQVGKRDLEEIYDRGGRPAPVVQLRGRRATDPQTLELPDRRRTEMRP